MMNKELIANLEKIHGSDEEQINFILSKDKKIIVKASAGCGKTRSMISKIAYELVTLKNLNFKKILALTFSVNAAIKIKEDTKEILPQLLKKESFNIDKKLDVSNYHSFSTKIISKHGYYLNEKLNNINNFTIVSDTDKKLQKYLTNDELIILNDFEVAINTVNKDDINQLISLYTDILLEKLILNEIITYNGLIVLANELLKNSNISDFYKSYYPLIIVDEFQDTNYLSYMLIKSLIDDNSRIIIMGDDMQKIYGFLGAIPNLFQHMQDKYKMTLIEFKNNYRFQNNEKMRNLDNYIRDIFKQYDNISNFKESAEINLGFFKTNESEQNSIVTSMKDKIKDGSKVALLVNIKKSADNIIEKLESDKLKYFNGLFSDKDDAYIIFHKIALEVFINESGVKKSISSRIVDNVLDKIESRKLEITDDKVLFNSINRLLKILFNKIKTSKLNKYEKYDEIIITLKSNSLKRLMNEVDENIVLTTIHGSKGLEWDYVYIPEITESKFPFYYGLCKLCKKEKAYISDKYSCEFTYPNNLKLPFEEQLSLFYVGITRAKKDVFLFANIDKNNNGFQKKRSCLTMLPNLNLNRTF